MSHDETAEEPVERVRPGNTSKRKPQKGNERKFFQQMQPTFAVSLPRRNTKIEFLDESNPAKDTIIRKKAREWVNQNRDRSRKELKKRRRAEPEVKDQDVESAQDRLMRLQRESSDDPLLMLSPRHTIGTRQYDPFDSLPEITMKHEHLLDYFLSGCPGKPPSDSGASASLVPFLNTTDEYAHRSRHSIIPFDSAKTILGNFAQSQVTWAMFLYAIVCMQQGFAGAASMDEIFRFCENALKELQARLNREVASGIYTEHLLLALSSITAISTFAGTFDAAIFHRDAMIRILAIRGNGDLLSGLQSLSPWAAKTLQWMEILVGAQKGEAPKIPYYHACPTAPLPDDVAKEAARRTAKTLSSLPLLKEPLQNIVLLLHQLAVAYDYLPSTTKTDIYILGPLYDAQYFLLHIIDTHKKTKNLSSLEALLAEAFHLYFAIGPRGQPPHVKLHDLTISRLRAALLPFLNEKADPANNAIAWSLAIGTIVSASMDRPEYAWFTGHLRVQYRDMGLDLCREAFRGTLDIFPTTNGYRWLDMDTVWEVLQD
ncbi:hypothetical protein IQ06DRAFT_224788 [Phaeosphaeriaceae sp. SRC1lsM3a]|nr:hypothetical protein IQ06DRAFT_224788 [Stagonospora sp. SRC1lsM3a]